MHDGTEVDPDLPRRPGEIYGATVRSPIARGRICSVRFDPSFDWSDVTTVQATDVATNRVAGIAADQPVLAEAVVNHAYEPIVLLACADPLKLSRAKLSVHLDIEPLEPVLDIDTALRGETLVWRPSEGVGEPGSNVMTRRLVTKGEADVDDALASCARVLSGTYSTHHQARLDSVLPAISALHAALLAKKSGRPVRMIHDPREDIEATPRRHPCVCEITTGSDADGTLRVLKMRILMDAGAYVTVTPDVLSRAVLHAGGVYAWPTARVEAVAVATNTPPNGALIGSGAAQTAWAIERHLDALAAYLGVEPTELKKQNLLAEGQSTPAGTVARVPSVRACLEDGLRASDYLERRKSIERDNAKRAHRGERRRVGIGATLVMQEAAHAQGADPTVAWMCSVVEVDVDLDTFEVAPKRSWLTADAGRSIDPTLDRGALEGGALVAYGWALSEEVIELDGLVENPRRAGYLVPTALDAPSFETSFVGASLVSPRSGLSELGVIGGAPAIAAAVEHATGIAVHHLPLTPERLHLASLGQTLANSFTARTSAASTSELLPC